MRQETAMVAPAGTMTPEEFLDFDDGVSYELVGGCPRERTMSTRSSQVGARILRRIADLVEDTDSGITYPPDLGIRIFLDPKDVLKADVSFIRSSRAPKEETSYLEIAPDFLVEVNSPSDKAKDIREKVQLWLNAGVGTVWVVEPTAKEVTVCLRGETPIVFTAESEITVGEALPGFRCKVSEFFPE
jgi:Uma2 family endonuclease